MAKITLSGLVQDIKGSIGAYTYGDWKGQHWIRLKSASISNPNTLSQIAMRASLVTRSRGWFGLTQTQRNLWNEFAKLIGAARQAEKAEGYGGIIPLGGPLMSGFNAYVGVNQLLASVGYAKVDVPPLPPFPVAPVISTSAFVDTPPLTLGVSVTTTENIVRAGKVQFWLAGTSKCVNAYVAEVSSEQASGAPLSFSTSLTTVRVGHDRNIGQVSFESLFGGVTTGPYHAKDVLRLQARFIDKDGGVSSKTQVALANFTL